MSFPSSLHGCWSVCLVVCLSHTCSFVAVESSASVSSILSALLLPWLETLDLCSPWNWSPGSVNLSPAAAPEGSVRQGAIGGRCRSLADSRQHLEVIQQPREHSSGCQAQGQGRTCVKSVLRHHRAFPSHSTCTPSGPGPWSRFLPRPLTRGLTCLRLSGCPLGPDRCLLLQLNGQ